MRHADYRLRVLSKSKIVMNRLITITKKRIEKAKTPNGGYNGKQLKIVGIKWPAPKGWRRELIGDQIPLKQFIDFVRVGGNTSYLEEIQSQLVNLIPPLQEHIEVTVERPVPKPTALSRKERRNARRKDKNLLKRERKRSERADKIKDFGIDRSIQAVVEKGGAALKEYHKTFLNKLAHQDNSTIAHDELCRLYDLLKKNGAVLTRSASGKVSLAKFTNISKVRQEQKLYVIRARNTDLLKIGVSKDPGVRRRGVQTGSPYKVDVSLVFNTLKNATKLETELHERFKKRRMQGEWFQGITNEEITKAIGTKGQVVK